MDLFRRKQKWVFVIIAIIIIPSFILVWGPGDLFNRSNSDANFEMGHVDGKKIFYPEYEGFRKRIQAATGGIPLYLPFTLGVGTNTEDLWKHIILYALLQDAEKTGFRASDLQVGTYIQNAHPAFANRNRQDPQSLERSVDALCRQLKISRADFLQGVREWQTIGNYIYADADLTTVTDEFVYRVYSFVMGELVVKRIRVTETDAVREQARKEISERPAEDLERDVRNHILARPEDPKFREPSEWRFAYVLLPYVSKTGVRQPTDEEIQRRYEDRKSSHYGDLPLDQVRERVADDLLQEEVDRLTRRNQTWDVDPVLEKEGATMDLGELVKLTQLAKYGVTAGTTGDATLPIDEVLAKLPAGAETMLRAIMNGLDRAGDSARETKLARWRVSFSAAAEPFTADQGLFRLRLLDYRASRPAAIDDENGKVRKDLHELAIVDMISERASQLVRERAEAMESRIREHMIALEQGNAQSDAELAEELAHFPEEVIPHGGLQGDNNPLGRLTIGELTQPQPYTDAETGAKGQEIVLVVDRRLPSREAFATEPEAVKMQLRQNVLGEFRGGFGMSYAPNSFGPMAAVEPGPAILGSIVERVYRNQIGINPELARIEDGQGR